MHLLGGDDRLETEPGIGAHRLMRGPGPRGGRPPRGGVKVKFIRESQALESGALSSAIITLLWPRGSDQAAG